MLILCSCQVCGARPELVEGSIACPERNLRVMIDYESKTHNVSRTACHCLSNSFVGLVLLTFFKESQLPCGQRRFCSVEFLN